jgi:hypothetical protein
MWAGRLLPNEVANVRTEMEVAVGRNVVPADGLGSARYPFLRKESHVTRKLIFLGIAAILALKGVSPVTAQSQATAQSQVTSKGLEALQRAAAADKYLFVFFWQEKSQQTNAMWGVFHNAMSKLADRADSVAINLSDRAEQPMVAKFGIDRSSLPLVLALAPNGAITKGFPVRFHEDQLSQAFVSPCTAECMKALQDRKLVVLCVEHPSPQVRQVSLQKGVQQFAGEEPYSRNSKVVVLNANDPAEATFLKSLQLDPRTTAPVTVLMAPPGSVVGTFVGNVTKAEMVAKLNSASSCGPNCSCHH